MFLLATLYPLRLLYLTRRILYGHSAAKKRVSNIKHLQDEAKPQEAANQKPTRLERAKAAIEVMEKRLSENKKVRERLKNLDAKLDQVNREMENAYVKIKDQLTRAELGHQRHHKNCTANTCSSVSPNHTVSSWENSVCFDRPSYQPVGKPKGGVASIEQRLTEMERALKRLDNIESCLAKLSVQLSNPSVRSSSTIPCNTSNRNLYGCHEINEIFSQTQAELQRARTAISRMLAMPAVYSMRTNAEGIRDRSELDTLGKLIDRFLVKLKNSKDAYENACGDAGNCIVCNMCTTSSITSRCSLY